MYSATVTTTQADEDGQRCKMNMEHERLLRWELARQRAPVAGRLLHLTDKDGPGLALFQSYKSASRHCRNTGARRTMPGGES